MFSVSDEKKNIKNLFSHYSAIQSQADRTANYATTFFFIFFDKRCAKNKIRIKMEGMSSNFSGTNAAMLQMSNYGNIQQGNSQQELTPKKETGLERLKKKMNIYRKRQSEMIPRFEQTFSGICEQQSMETNLLQKKFLESKAKRVAKKTTDKKQGEVVGNVAVVSWGWETLVKYFLSSS